jgi:tetratricopeptide (TPR) repeat protein
MILRGGRDGHYANQRSDDGKSHDGRIQDEGLRQKDGVDIVAPMPAGVRRAALASVALVMGGIALHAQSSAPPFDIYRDAIALYARTGDAGIALKPLLGWGKRDIEAAVADMIKRSDARDDAARIEAAAMLHLEIGVALAGVSPASAEVYLDLGSRLADDLVVPNEEVRRTLKPERLADIALFRTTWNGVAGSAFLSVSDAFRARPHLSRAQKITPKSAAILTLQGIADELDSAVDSPEDFLSAAAKGRAGSAWQSGGLRPGLLFTAEALFREALVHEPGYALAHIHLGRVQFFFDKPSEAAASLAAGTAAAQHPSHRYLAAMFTGALRQSQNDISGARQSFEEALALAPRSQSAIAATAYLDLITGRPDRAHSLVRDHLQSIDPDEAWWVHKNGTLDVAGLQWLRKQVRQ